MYRQWAGQYGSVRPLRGLNHRTMLIQVRETVHCTVQTMDGTVQLNRHYKDNTHLDERVKDEDQGSFRLTYYLV